MSNRGRYQGDGIGLVDDKGRVAIPAALRATLAANAPKDGGKSGGTVIVGPHQNPAYKCLIAYDQGYLDIMAEQLDRREAANTGPDGEFDYNIKRRAAVGEAVPFDGSGRFIMPAFPRFYANIGEHAYFYGTLDYIEIWNPAALVANASMPEQVRDAARFHMMQKGIAA